jgi:O-antigen/teichoic acid export membrane protein
MGLLQKLAGQTALYGISSIVARMLNYLLVPLHTHIHYGFGASEYGIFSELYAYVAFLNILYTYGMETAFFRFAAAQPSAAGKQRVFNQLMSCMLVSTVLFSALLWWLTPNLSSALGYTDRPYLLYWLIGILSIDTLLALPYAQLRLQGKASRFAAARVFNIGLNVLLNVFFLVICRQMAGGAYGSALQPLGERLFQPELGIGYVFLANLLANGAVILWFWPIFSAFRWDWDGSVLKPVLHYAWPLMLMGLAGMVNEVSDRALLKYWLPAHYYPNLSPIEAVGVYSAVYKLAIFMSLVTQAFRYAAEPFFFGQSADKKAPQTFARVMRYFVLACCMIYVGVSLNLSWLQYFLGQEVYRQGIWIVPLLLLANLCLGVYQNLSIWFKLTDSTIAGAWLTGLGALITVGVNFALIPQLGYPAAAIATLVAYATMMVVCYLWGQKHYPIPYEVGYALSLIAAATVLIVVGHWAVQGWSFWPSLGLHWGLIGVFLALIAWYERPLLIAIGQKLTRR